MLPARSDRERKLTSRAVDTRQAPPIGEMKRAVLFAVIHHLDFDGEEPVQVLDVQHEVSQDRAALKHECSLRPDELDRLEDVPGAVVCDRGVCARACVCEAPPPGGCTRSV